MERDVRLPGSQVAHACSARSADKRQALRDALAGSGFDGIARARLGEQGHAAVKVNITGALASGAAEGTYTDPELVDELVRALERLGFRRISVVDSRVSSTPVAELAARVGYTAEGYELVDLSDATEPLDYGGVLGRHPVAPVWRDADFRVSFAKNKTHWECFYSGAMANLLGCLPEPDKAHWYRGNGHTAAECVRTVIDALPVHFGIVDAWVSRDSSGRPGRGGHARQTGSVLASASLVALDWLMGEKMDVDPALNPVVQEALFRWGRFHLLRDGDLMPWEPWQSPGAATVALGALVGGRGAWTIQ